MKNLRLLLARQSFRVSEYDVCTRTKECQAQLSAYEKSSVKERNISTVRTQFKCITRNKN